MKEIEAKEAEEEVEKVEEVKIEEPKENVTVKKIDPNDPYWNHVEDDSLQMIYDQLKDGAIPEADLSFEFEPKFEPK